MSGKAFRMATRAIGRGFQLLRYLLLDGMLPKKSKFEVGRDLHGAGINIPTLMLTARSQVVDKVVGLRMGGMTI